MEENWCKFNLWCSVLQRKLFLQKVQTFKCLTIDVSGQKEVVMALLPQKKQFQTVTMLYGLVFTSRIVDSFKKVLELLCNFSCTIQYNSITDNLATALTFQLFKHSSQKSFHFHWKPSQRQAERQSNTCFLQNQESPGNCSSGTTAQCNRYLRYPPQFSNRRSCSITTCGTRTGVTDYWWLITQIFTFHACLLRPPAAALS